MDPLQAYSAFVRTLEAGSFSAVARETGASQSAISKQIASLEQSLGVQLFARTTRRLQPTPEALQLYEHVRQLLDAVEAVRVSGNRQIAPSGTLRITIPGAYGRRRICPRLPEFLKRFPEVRVEILMTDQILDLVEEGLELGIRIGNLAPSSLVARPLGIINQIPIATPEYVAAHGMPDSPQDLADHACILYSGGAKWTRWEFESEYGRSAVEVSGPIRVNDSETMFDMVCAHQGIALVPDWLADDAVASGRVLWLLRDYYPIPQPVNIVYPRGRFLSARARSFIDFFVDQRRGGAGTA